MRIRRKILVSIIVAIIIAGLAVSYFVGLITIPRSTNLTINPSDFVVESGSSVMLSAQLKSDSFILTGKPIKWSASDGSFDKTTGESVLFTAPLVTEEKTITITASFAGDSNYLSSSVTITGKVIPRKAIETVLSISPSTFELESNGVITLKAILSPSSAPNDLITWILDGPGMLSSTVGPSVTYRAPEVKERTTVTITAKFPGSQEYSESTATCSGAVLPVGTSVRKVTILNVNPSSFTLKPSEEVTITASLQDSEGNTITNKLIAWNLEGPGKLSSVQGTSVNYVAPDDVKEKITVKITVTFNGDDEYIGSTAIVTGEIIPVSVTVREEYLLTFEKGSFSNVKIDGPVVIDGRKVVRIIADNIVSENTNLSRIGLMASYTKMTNIEMYITSITARIPESGQTLKITSVEPFSPASYDAIILENVELYVVKLVAKTIELEGIKVVTEHVGGAEPYVPSIIYSPKISITEGYELTGPETFNELKNAVQLMKMGKLEATDLVLAHPAEYHLDRGKNTFTSIDKWLARASLATFEDISKGYVIFITFNAYGAMIVTLSGEDNPNLPYSANKGTSGIVYDGSVHLVYAEIGKMTAENFILEIK